VKTLSVKNLFLSNAALKIICLFFGYSFWYVASYDHVITFSTSVPLCFTALNNTYDITAPEKISITIKGKRSALYALEKDNLAAHININELLPGKHSIIITKQHLFLPKSVMLVDYKPSNLTVTIRTR
jgi:YbbR domain-containing protein